jgi:hypothetical protein
VVIGLPIDLCELSIQNGKHVRPDKNIEVEAAAATGYANEH